MEPALPGAPAPPAPQPDAQIQIVRGRIADLLGRASRSQEEQEALVAARRTLSELQAERCEQFFGP